MKSDKKKWYLSICAIIGLLITLAVVQLPSMMRDPNLVNPDRLGTGSTSSGASNSNSDNSTLSPVPTSSSGIPAPLLADQENLKPATGPSDEATQSTESNIPKFECSASLTEQETDSGKLIILFVSAPKSVQSVWADVKVGANSNQIEVFLSAGFARLVVGEFSRVEKLPKTVEIFSVPIFLEEMILCKG